MEPRDKKLYNKTKKIIYQKIPKHSAYRSGILVKTYKKKFWFCSFDCGCLFIFS